MVLMLTPPPSSFHCVFGSMRPTQREGAGVFAATRCPDTCAHLHTHAKDRPESDQVTTGRSSPAVPHSTLRRPGMVPSEDTVTDTCGDAYLCTLSEDTVTDTCGDAYLCTLRALSRSVDDLDYMRGFPSTCGLMFLRHPSAQSPFLDTAA
uniref:Uncharacterized protein n=1 Tax=Knipowitschia caucasica TaxID=637954 RepID=A0AAV2KCH6_KNICA